jgi:3-dehydroquinate dehydratase type I
MHNARICAVVTETDVEGAHNTERIADLFEIRIDLTGPGWEQVATRLHKPWIAANRDKVHGGKWDGLEKDRLDALFQAISLGASMVDIEMGTGGMDDIVSRIKAKARCIVSFHDWEGTPSLDTLSDIVQQQLDAHADICKIITTARTFEDNITVLKLIKKYPWADIIAFAMGDDGLFSRILSPLAGGYLTYASLKKGSESAPGQITVEDMHSIYRMIGQQ